jgi:hypothetical protein
MFWESASKSPFSSFTKLQLSNIFVLTVHCKLLIFFQIFHLLFLKFLLASCFILFKLSPFISLGFDNHCNFLCFLWPNNFSILRRTIAYTSSIHNNLGYLAQTNMNQVASVVIQHNTQRYVLGDITLHNHRCEDLNSCISRKKFELGLLDGISHL